MIPFYMLHFYLNTGLTPPLATPNRRWSSGHWLRKQQRVPPSARVRKHDWSHMPAFSTITTAGIYLVAPHSSPHTQPPTLSGSASQTRQGGASGARHGVIVKTETLSHQSSFKIINNYRQIKILQTQQYDARLCALSFNVRYMFICRET